MDVGMQSNPSGSTRRARTTVVLLILLTLLLGVLFVGWRVHEIDHQMREEILLQTRMVAGAICVKSLKTLSGTEEDLTSSEYTHIKGQLSQVRAANPLVRFLYLMAKKPDGTLFFLVDSEPPDSRDYSPPGQIYDEASEQERTIFSTGKASAEGGPTTDRWGTWISALVPLFDPETGKVLALLGMDVDATTWAWNKAFRAAPPIILTLLVLALGISLVVLNYAFRVVRKKEATLRESETDFRMLFENTPDAYFFYDENAVLQDANEAFERLLGYTREVILGKNLIEAGYISDAKDQKRGLTILAANRENRPTGPDELSVIHKNGARVVIELYTVPVIHDDHRHFFGIARDITERIRTERVSAIRLDLMDFAATHSLDDLLRKTLDAVCDITESTIGFYHFINPDQETLTLQAWSTRTLNEFCKAEGKGHHYPISEAGVWVDCVQARRPVIHNDYASLPHKKGMPPGHADVMRELTVPIMREGRVEAILGVGNKPTDYTDADVRTVSYLADVALEIALRRKAEEALKASDERFRTFLDSTSDFVFLEDDQNHRLFVNKAQLDFLGKTEHEVLGKSVFEFMPEDIATRCHTSDQLAKETGKVLIEEENWGDRVFEIQKFPVPLGDGRRGVGGFIRDITARKQLEREGETARAETQRLLSEAENSRRVLLSMVEDQREAQSALEESEERFKTLFQDAPDAYYLCDLDGKLLDVNKATEQLLGYSRRRLIGKTFEELGILPDENSAQSAHAILRASAEGRATGPDELLMTEKEGRRIPVEISTVPITLRGKLHILGIARDITVRKRIERELLNSTQQWRSTFDAMNDAVFLSDASGVILRCNNATTRLLGRAYHEIVGKHCYSILHGADRHIENCPLVRTRESLARESLTYQLGERWLNIMTDPILDENKTLIGIVHILADMTAQVRAEAQLKEYSTNLEQMVENRTKQLALALNDSEAARDRIDGILKSVADGLIVTDEQHRVALMNRAAEEILGIHFNDVIDKPLEQVIEQTLLSEMIRQTVRGGKSAPQSVEFQLPGEDVKHPRMMHAQASVIKDRKGKKHGAVTIIYDVTREREIDRMKTEFISTAAHELRTPLTSIQGFSELLMTRDNLSEEERKRFVSYINRQSVGLGAIISDLLDISRIESGMGFTLNKQPCVIDELIQQSVALFQTSTPTHTFDVSLPETPTELVADRLKVTQILKNLLSNAVKYSPNGGTIRVSGKRESLCYQVCVADEGMGMTPEQVARVFDRFYRADASNTAIEGTGLGMSIVKYIVEAHGGTVSVNSVYDEGTTVCFCLPFGTTGA